MKIVNVTIIREPAMFGLYIIRHIAYKYNHYETYLFLYLLSFLTYNLVFFIITKETDNPVTLS